MAYLHIGMNVMVEDRRVIGIFDLDNTSTSKKTREFLQGAEQEGVGGINSWGADVEDIYHISGEQDISYGFWIE